MACAYSGYLFFGDYGDPKNQAKSGHAIAVSLNAQYNKVTILALPRHSAGPRGYGLEVWPVC